MIVVCGKGTTKTTVKAEMEKTRGLVLKRTTEATRSTPSAFLGIRSLQNRISMHVVKAYNGE